MSDQHQSTGEAHGDDHGVGHVVPFRILIATGTALLVLTWVTVVTARLDLGEGNIYLALGIACLKGGLVALFFMHLRWDRPFNSVIFIGSLAFVALFLALAMTDTAEYQPDLIKGDAKAVVDTIASNEKLERRRRAGGPSIEDESAPDDAEGRPPPLAHMTMALLDKSPFDDPARRFSAGRFGMSIFIVALAVLFAATALGVIVVRWQLQRSGQWPGDLPRLPWGMAISTVGLGISSVSMHRASRLAAGDTIGDAGPLGRAMLLTTMLGVAFLLVQAACWWSWLAVVRERWADSADFRVALTAFYVLTGLHALHVVGGLVALVATTAGIRGRRYDAAGRHERVHYCAMYWHFLGVAWLGLYAILLAWG